MVLCSLYGIIHDRNQMKQNFKADLAFGQEQEKKLLEKYPSLKALDGRQGDFFHALTGKRGEL